MIVDIYKYFKLHPRYNRLVGDDYLFVEYKCPVNIEVFELWTEFHLITFVINGRKDWITESNTYKIEAGDSLLIKKGVYRTKQYLEEEYCVILFFLNDDYIKRFMAENDHFSDKAESKGKPGQVFPIQSTEILQSLIESIFHYLKQRESIPRKLVELKFQELLYNILLNPENQGIRQFFMSVSNSSKTNMEDMMMMNYRSDLSIVAFARLCGRSLSTFKRDFKLQFHTTPSKWIMSKRLEYAKMLIIETDLNINEICYESGFKNNSHFINTFKSIYKQTPGQFKKNYRAA